MKARGDELALARLADDPEIPDDIIGFHAQQAAAARRWAEAAITNG